MESPLYLVSNLGLVSLLALLSDIQRRHIDVLFVAIVSLLGYAGMIVLMQNQTRYQLLITPVAIVCSVLWFSMWTSKRFFQLAMLGLALMYTAIDVRMFNKIQRDVRMERQGLSDFNYDFSFLDTDSRVVLLGNNLGGWIPVIYAVRPAPAMIVFRSLLSDESFAQALNLFEPDYILARDGLKPDVLHDVEYIATFENMNLFDLDVYRIIK
jgi:hypothetical protein